MSQSEGSAPKTHDAEMEQADDNAEPVQNGYDAENGQTEEDPEGSAHIQPMAENGQPEEAHQDSVQKWHDAKNEHSEG
ncbi:hypothetical protein [Pseudoalteromonas sp. T1lg22]|uniref:hypothetical protein n=1 Tax=Pseudoalteromonas sp. T1lg22 TaxID=2077096 RepID=UPI001319BEA1|nr:hypothetical protein [Pseudoalteromonas sp. T1lg22]